MALKYICETGGEEYPVSVNFSGQATYQYNDSKIVSITDEHQDCVNCEQEVAKEISGLKEEARQRVRERKQNG